MSNSATFSFTEPEILESIEALPTEDDLPCDGGEPMETPRHREQMELRLARRAHGGSPHQGQAGTERPTEAIVN
jgi:hypothetical protein